MKLASILAGAAALCAVTASAEAKVYDFSFTGEDVSGSGVITTVDAGSPSTVDSITGTVFDSEVGAGPFTIEGLSSYAGADNLLIPVAAPFVDFAGLSFTTDAGGDFNLGLGGGGPLGLILNSSVLNPSGMPVSFPGSVNISLKVTAAGVPEPAAWAAMLIGFGGIGAAMRGVRRKQAVLT
jgi:hypothetical protein